MTIKDLKIGDECMLTTSYHFKTGSHLSRYLGITLYDSFEYDIFRINEINDDNSITYAFLSDPLPNGIHYNDNKEYHIFRTNFEILDAQKFADIDPYDLLEKIEFVFNVDEEKKKVIDRIPNESDLLRIINQLESVL